MTKSFAAALEEFERLLKVAPRGVNGRMSAKEFELHAELLRAVDDLTALAFDRARLSMATDEVEELGADTLWLVLDPADSTSLGAVRAAVADFASKLPTSLEEWERVLDLGVSMAGAGDVAARTEWFAMATLAAASGPDGGMLDKTYEQAFGTAGRTQW